MQVARTVSELISILQSLQIDLGEDCPVLIKQFNRSPSYSNVSVKKMAKTGPLHLVSQKGIPYIVIGD